MGEIWLVWRTYFGAEAVAAFTTKEAAEAWAKVQDVSPAEVELRDRGHDHRHVVADAPTPLDPPILEADAVTSAPPAAGR